MTFLKHTLLHIQRFWLPLTVLLACVISLLSLFPAPNLPPIPGTDKTHHFIAYAGLVFPIALAKPKHWYWIVLAMLCVSGLIELIQPYVNRYGEWLDLAANAGGLCSGVILATMMAKLIKSNEQTTIHALKE